MRRGTSVHALIKKHYSQPFLVPPDIDPAVAGPFERFLASRFNRVPVVSEMPFEFPLGTAVVRGRIDTILETEDRRLEIVDFKSGSAPKRSEIEERLQLPVYALAASAHFGRPHNDLDYTYFFLADGREERFSASERLASVTSDRIAGLIQAIERQEFTPRRGCSCYACRRRRETAKR